MTHQNSPSPFTSPTLMRSSGGRESHSEEPSDQAPTQPTRAEGQRLRSRTNRTSREPATSVRRSFRQSVRPNAWPGTKPWGSTNPLQGLPFVCKSDNKIHQHMHYPIAYLDHSLLRRFSRGSLIRGEHRTRLGILHTAGVM